MLDIIKYLKESTKGIKNIQEMGKDIHDGNLVGAVKNYFESLPGVVAISSGLGASASFTGKLLAKQLAPYLSAKGVAAVSGSTAKLASAAKGAVKWYLKPAAVTAKKATTVATNLASASKVVKGGVITAAVLLGDLIDSSITSAITGTKQVNLWNLKDPDVKQNYDWNSLNRAEKIMYAIAPMGWAYRAGLGSISKIIQGGRKKDERPKEN